MVEHSLEILASEEKAHTTATTIPNSPPTKPTIDNQYEIIVLSENQILDFIDLFGSILPC